MTTGDKLRAVRARYSWTREGLALRLNINRSTLSRWETGAARIEGAALVLLDGMLDDTFGPALARWLTAHVLEATC